MEQQIDWTQVYSGSDHDEKFRQFHQDNPHVLQTLIWKTGQLVNRGHRKVGIGMLFEVMRWDHMLSTGDEPFKLNNNYRAYYSRLIMQLRPEWLGIFETRSSMADDAKLLERV